MPPPPLGPPGFGLPVAFALSRRESRGPHFAGAVAVNVSSSSWGRSMITVTGMMVRSLAGQVRYITRPKSRTIRVPTKGIVILESATLEYSTQCSGRSTQMSECAMSP